MVETPKYDKNRDLGETIPNLALNITEALETGVVRDTPVPIDTYNMMTDTDEVGGIVRDSFSALDAAKAIDAQMSTSGED